MARKKGPISRTTRYRRKREARSLGCAVAELPDRRGSHSQHARASAHPRWNDHRIEASTGYVLVRVGRSHPLANPNGYVYEHKLVWLSSGRTIPSGYVIHHRNHDKHDNRLANLECLLIGDHVRLHVACRD
jgi:hypothetical protein